MSEDLEHTTDPEATRTMSEKKCEQWASAPPDEPGYVEYASPHGAAGQPHPAQNPSPPFQVHYPYPPPSYLYQSTSLAPEPPSYPVYSYPLPPGTAIKQLPHQYLRVLTRPDATFAQEKQKAAWNIVRVQLVLLAVIGAISGYLNYAFFIPQYFSVLHLSKISAIDVIGLYKDQAVQGSLQWLITLPAAAFLLGSITYLLARGFHGQGTYLEHIYCTLLFFVPAQLIGNLLSSIPLMGLVSIPLAFVYSLFVLIRMTMAVHGLNAKKASLTILLLPASALVLVLCGVLLVLLILVPLLFL
jgi:hypothetical protein